MPNYFLDTSALAKRYHKENGSEYMDRILDRSGSRSLISNLSIVELESVLAIKGQIGVLVAADQRLCRVASLAGCSAVNPEHSGPLLFDR